MKRGSIKVCTADKTQKGAKKESKNAQIAKTKIYRKQILNNLLMLKARHSPNNNYSITNQLASTFCECFIFTHFERRKNAE